jgi:radical SAM superfamily enzyme YgiQ (UPF0313 family)
MQMKVKLLYPPRKWDSEVDTTSVVSNNEHDLIPPFGITRLTSHLLSNGVSATQDDIDIKVYRLNQSDDFDEHIDLSVFEDQRRIEEFLNGKKDKKVEGETLKLLGLTEHKGVDIFGFSLIGSRPSSIGSTLAMARLLKDDFDAKIVLGGLSWQQGFFTKYNVVDYLISGRGEMPFLKLCMMLEGEEMSAADIPGLIYKSAGALKINRPWIVTERFFPMPTFEGLPLDLYRYKADPDDEGVLLLPYMFVDGCCFKCAFCPRSELPFLALNDVETVVKELGHYVKTYDTKTFFFLNSSINPTYKYAESFADMVLGEGLDIRWTDCANFKHLDKRLLKKLRDAGAVRLVYGIESASRKMLDYVGKPIDISRAQTLLRQSHELGIWNEIELIAGMPYENEQDIRNTIRFVRQNSKFVNFFYLNTFILKGSRMLARPDEYGIGNIRENSEETFNLRRVGRKFDEVSGLKWEEKMHQQENSFKRILEVIQSTNELGSDIHTIMYAYLKLIGSWGAQTD